MASPLVSVSEQTPSSQIEANKAVTGGIAGSNGMASTAVPVPQSVTAGGTQQHESSSSGTGSSDSVLPLNGSVSSSSSTTLESAAELGATGITNDTEHKSDIQQVQENCDGEETSSEAPAIESTLLDVTADTQHDSLDVPAQPMDGEHLRFGDETQIDHDFDYASHDHPTDEATHLEHLPEPPASPISNTLLSTPSNSACDDLGNGTKVEPKARVPSANRISISYAGGNRRLVIDAEVVQSMKVSRHAGIIEVVMDLSKLNENEIKGILFEVLSDATKSYTPLPALLDSSNPDATLPPFWKVTMPATVTLLLYLDTERPLSEPKWARTGDIQEWLRSMFGRMFWVAGDAAEGWEKKIHVADPDPPPTIWTVLDGWATNSTAGVVAERQKFLKTHMMEIDNILEILLRLVRGERATPFSQSTPTLSGPSVVGPLLSALTPGSAHASQQTHVSLAVLALLDRKSVV